MAEKKATDFIHEFERDYPETDLVAYFGPIRRPFDDDFIAMFESRPGLHKNIVLCLTTLGGDPDAAYRISRCLQRMYGLLPPPKADQARRSVSVFVDSVCASAGTLIALGATQLIMSEYAELSPLDIQVRKPDDVWERDSGLTPTQALDILERRSKSLFKEHFNQLRLDNEMGLTTKTAVEVSSTVTTGLLAPIYGQLDPMRLAEFERLMGITAGYGERLAKYNLKRDALARLLMGYPSHNFVIDRCEAEELFSNVAVPKPGLRAFGEFFRKRSQHQMNERLPVKFFLTEAPQPPEQKPADQTEAPVEATGTGHHDEQAQEGDGAAAAGTRPRRRAPRRGGEAVQ
jgi:hypothetical protein